MNICELLENNLNTQQQEEQQDDNENSDLGPSDKDQTSDKKEPSESKSSIDDEEDTNEEDIDYNKMIDFFSTNDSSNDYKISHSLNLADQNNSNTNSNQNENNQYQNNQHNDYNNINNNNNYSLMSNDDDLAFDALNPFEKFCKLCDNPKPSNIESASKYVVPALEFCATQEDFTRVFFYLKKYCFFSDVLLRSLWLEQIQNVIQYLHQEQGNISVEFTNDFNMANRLALLISELMREPAYQVKKCATASLLYIIERQLLDNNQIEHVIVPCLLSLVKENNEDFHIDCVSLFGKLAPLIGRNLTTKYFLEPFCRLCSSPVFHTRKACASNIADIANIVSVEDVEQYLLPHFCEFMKDQVWAIRKVCADLFSTFALRCTRETRRTFLTECFTRLLDDHSRWVKISAYKSLGSFIATFSVNDAEKEKTEKIENQQSTEIKTENDQNLKSTVEMSESDSAKKEGEYSNFIYWRNTLPTLDDNLQTANTNQQDSTPTLTGLLNSSNLIDSTHIHKTPNQQHSNLYSSTNSLFSNQHNQQTPQQQQAALIDQLSSEMKQDIVPPILLSYFITMVDINTQNSLDSEMNYNCAFNFPAIALTLGVKYWKFIKNLYKKLAEDVSWKVRQTLAFSIHELAIILGTENTQNDLVPVFDSYIKDVDEVRIGIVSNLTKFFQVLSMDYRRTYMPKLNDFLKMDNQRNWRFRNELGLQIASFSELFPPDCLAEFVQPVAFTLALDKVAEVRVTAIKALVEILRQFEVNKRLDYRRNFVDDVVRTFANSNKWTFRQLYVTMCENILMTKAYTDLESFIRDFLPKLLSYRNEKVPNIRVLVARVLSTYIVNCEFFTNGKSSLLSELELTVQYLSNDSDSDVRSYFPSTKQNSSLPSYEELYKNKENESFEQKNLMDTSSNSDCQMSKQTSDDKMHEDQADDEDEEDEDDEDDEDEIIDKTKINQLKIVNLENELDDDDEMDEIIETRGDLVKLSNGEIESKNSNDAEIVLN